MKDNCTICKKEVDFDGPFSDFIYCSKICRIRGVALKALMSPLAILLFVFQSILPLSIGAGLIWMFGWTYGYILASLVFILAYGGIGGAAAMTILMWWHCNW